mmetsp:Transcript_27772/g.69615  ORF Transcript_27772/g.69615 Transcript_27772/m.69615 type:complete len:203 (+) Transcript_27772:614-1222(+)
MVHLEHGLTKSHSTPSRTACASSPSSSPPITTSPAPSPPITTDPQVSSANGEHPETVMFGRNRFMGMWGSPGESAALRPSREASEIRSMGNPSEKLVQCTEANSGSVGRRGTPDAATRIASTASSATAAAAADARSFPHCISGDFTRDILTTTPHAVAAAAMSLARRCTAMHMGTRRAGYVAEGGSPPFPNHRTSMTGLPRC